MVLTRSLLLRASHQGTGPVVALAQLWAHQERRFEAVLLGTRRAVKQVFGKMET
jgi:hypothetical protein